MDLCVRQSRVLEVCRKDTHDFSHVTGECTLLDWLISSNGMSITVKISPDDNEIVQQVDRLALAYMKENKDTVFLKKHKLVVSDSDIDKVFTSSFACDGTLRVKVPVNKTAPVDVYDSHRQLLLASDDKPEAFLSELDNLLSPGVSHVKIAFGAPIVWVFKEMAGVTWRVRQIQIVK